MCAVRDGHRELTSLELDEQGGCSCGKMRCSRQKGVGLLCYENASVCAETWPKFFEITEGNCGKAGRDDFSISVTHPDTCELGAQQLHWDDTTMMDDKKIGFSSVPPGCYLDYGILSLNLDGSNLGKCKPNVKCICAVAPECKHVDGMVINSGAACRCGAQQLCTSGSTSKLHAADTIGRAARNANRAIRACTWV